MIPVDLSSPRAVDRGDLFKTDLPRMTNRTLEQLYQENTSWIRSLDHMEQENVYLKTRLSRFTEKIQLAEQLNWAEDYQTRILQKEAAIALIRQDVHEQEGKIADAYNDQDTALTELFQKQNILRLKIEYIENRFLLLKRSFNHELNVFLSES